MSRYHRRPLRVAGLVYGGKVNRGQTLTEYTAESYNSGKAGLPQRTESFGDAMEVYDGDSNGSDRGGGQEGEPKGVDFA